MKWIILLLPLVSACGNDFCTEKKVQRIGRCYYSGYYNCEACEVWFEDNTMTLRCQPINFDRIETCEK